MSKLWTKKPKKQENNAKEQLGNLISTVGDYGVTTNTAADCIKTARIDTACNYIAPLPPQPQVGWNFPKSSSAALPSEPHTGTDWMYYKVRFTSLNGDFYPEFLDEVNGFVYTPVIFHFPDGDRIVYKKYVYNGA